MKEGNTDETPVGRRRTRAPPFGRGLVVSGERDAVTGGGATPAPHGTMLRGSKARRPVGTAGAAKRHAAQGEREHRRWGGRAEHMPERAADHAVVRSASGHLAGGGNLVFEHRSYLVAELWGIRIAVDGDRVFRCRPYYFVFLTRDHERAAYFVRQRAAVDDFSCHEPTSYGGCSPRQPVWRRGEPDNVDYPQPVPTARASHIHDGATSNMALVSARGHAHRRHACRTERLAAGRTLETDSGY